MRKTILKTILYTLLSVFSALLIFFSVATLFFPSFLANVSYSLGNKTLTVWFTEQEYSRTMSVNVLNKLVYRVKWQGDDKKIIKYSLLLIEDGDFSKLCDKTDKANAENVAIEGSFKEYIYSDYVTALYDNLETDKAVAFATNGVLNGEYPINNAYQRLMYEMATRGDAPNLENMLSDLENTYLANISSDETALSRAQKDLEFLKKALADMGTADMGAAE